MEATAFFRGNSFVPQVAAEGDHTTLEQVAAEATEDTAQEEAGEAEV